MANLKDVIGNKISSTVERLDKETVVNKKVMDNILAFCSLGTGAGNSTIAENVAYVLSKRDFHIAVVDLNIEDNAYFKGKFVKESEESKMDLIDYINKDIELYNIVNKGKGVDYFCATDRNIKDMIDLDEKEYAKKINNMIKLFSQLYDLVIIDAPYKLENESINTAIYRCDRAFLVIDENYRSIIKAKKWIENCRITGIEINNRISFIFNKKTDIRISGARLKEIGIEPKIIVPYTKDVVEAGLSNKLLCRDCRFTDKNSNYFADGIELLADLIIKESKTEEDLEEEFKKAGKKKNKDKKNKNNSDKVTDNTDSNDSAEFEEAEVIDDDYEGDTDNEQ